MLTDNHRTEHRDHNGSVRERTEEIKGICKPIGRTPIRTPELPGTKPPTKVYTVETQCHNVGECQGGEVGVGGWVGETRSYKRGGGEFVKIF